LTLTELDRIVVTAVEDLLEGKLSPDEAIAQNTPEAILGVLEFFANLRGDDAGLAEMHDRLVKAIDALPVVR